MIRLTLCTGALLALMGAAPAQAAEPLPGMQDFLDAHIVGWVQDPVIVDAIGAQNATTQGYTQDQIDEMDTRWRAEVGTGDSALIDGVLTNPASDFLRTQVDGANGMITEIFVMDAHGLNVAASGATSDYWQGDEEKHAETYGKGAGAVHFSEVEFDESSQTYQAQISVTITDPATGEAIGAVTVGVDAEAMM